MNLLDDIDSTTAPTVLEYRKPKAGEVEGIRVSSPPPLVFPRNRKERRCGLLTTKTPNF